MIKNSESQSKTSMDQLLKTSELQKAIDAVEILPIEDQAVLINILSDRLKQRQSQQVVLEIKEVQQEYREGKVKFGSIGDFLSELDN